jgi:hypothetical protein
MACAHGLDLIVSVTVERVAIITQGEKEEIFLLAAEIVGALHVDD